MLRSTCLLVSLLLLGCQSGTPVVTDLTPSPTVTSVQNESWFTYYAPDGTYSVQFPKAPEQVGSKGGNLMLAHPLDKQASNLSLVQTPLPKGFTPGQLRKDPARLFGKGVKVAKFTPGKVQGRESVDLELEAGPNRVWVRMIFDDGSLYQLIGLQSATSPQDYLKERQQFWASFQFTQKAGQ